VTAKQVGREILKLVALATIGVSLAAVTHKVMCKMGAHKWMVVCTEWNNGSSKTTSYECGRCGKAFTI
jgi:hypothetical protein